MGGPRKTRTHKRDINICVQAAFPVVRTISYYIEQLNKVIARHGVQVEHNPGIADDPSYRFLLNNLLIAADIEPIVPENSIEGLRGKSTTVENVIEGVIRNSIRMFAKDRSTQNVIALGYSALSPFGQGSLFPSLDSRAPSTVVQILLSPCWRHLFSSLGHVVTSHLLSTCALLLPLDNESFRSGKRRKLSSRHSASQPVFLQLSGPIPRSLSAANNRRKNTAVIQYSKSMIDRRARANFKPVIPFDSQTDTIFPGTTSHDSKLQVQSKKRALNDGLPLLHFLQRLDTTFKSGEEFFHQVFTPKERKGPRDYIVPRKRKIPKRLRSVIPLLQGFVQRTNARSFRVVLGRICPLPLWVRLSKKALVDLNLLTSSRTNPRKIAQFLVFCLRQSLPAELLGSEANFILLAKGVHTFIRKRTRNEHFNISKFAANSGFKLASIPWLHRSGSNGRRVCNPTDLAFRKTMFLRLLSWVFQEFLIPLLLNSFHVTDSQFFGVQIIFYRREVWYRLLDTALKDVLHSNRRLFSPISSDEVKGAMIQLNKTLTNFGIHSTSSSSFITCFQLRFIPKMCGTRPIQRLHARQWFDRTTQGYKFTGCTNRITDPVLLKKNLDKARNAVKSFLSIALKILFVCCRRHRARLLGSSVFGLDDVYPKFLHFKRDWLQQGRKPIYAVAMDMTKSFDNIPLQVLANEILPQIIEQDRFVLLRFAVITRRESNHGLLRRFESHICLKPGDEASFRDLVVQKLRFKYPRAIFVDLVRTQVVHRRELLDCIQHVLLDNIVVLPRHTKRCSVSTPYARQIRGVGQGNPLSPLLTSLFYGFVERSYLPEFLNPHGNENNIFVRQIDDIFFCSTKKDLAVGLAEKLTKGWDDVYGVNINCSKTRNNFSHGSCLRNARRWIPWCGLLIDSKTLEVMNDFSRYRSPRLNSLREIISADFTFHTGAGLAQKAWTCFRPKIHPILIDEALNSVRTVCLNIYQAALLTALKICSYALAIELRNENFMARIIQTAITRICTMTRKAPCSAIGSENQCVLSLKGQDVRFLVEHAFFWVLFNRFSNYQRGQLLSGRITNTLQTTLDSYASDLEANRPDRMELFKTVYLSSCNEVLWSIPL